MANSKKKRYLIGKGELLTSPSGPWKPTPGGPPAYPFSRAQKKLPKQISDVAHVLDKLPAEACPGDKATAFVVMHPTALSKSAFPSSLLRNFSLTSLGSRSIEELKPESWGQKKKPKNGVAESYAIYVAGKRNAFHEWSEKLASAREGKEGSGIQWQKEVRTVESVHAVTSADRIRPFVTKRPESLFESVVFTGRGHDEVIDGFYEYLRFLGVKPDMDRRRQVGDLCFFGIKAPKELVERIADFSYLRVIREMPQIGKIMPVIRNLMRSGTSVYLPGSGPISKHFRAAIFDGGLDITSPLTKWATPYETEGVGQPHRKLLEHGSSVTSAFLFGHLEPNSPVEIPYCHVDHYRVIGSGDGADDDLFSILDRIAQVLNKSRYDLINLSLGPRLPIDDNDPHVWTSALDEIFKKKNIFATIAVGNDGELAGPAGRLQPASDAVNGFAVGASDRLGNGWGRASYSCLGPGRPTGGVKPDVVAFGGSDLEGFGVIDPHKGTDLASTMGTSFSAPSALRIAAGMRSFFEPNLSPLLLKALLIHRCEKTAAHPVNEVGHGRLPMAIDELASCADGEATIIYEGELPVKRWLKMPIPLPENEMQGNVEITATFCYMADCDPAHPPHYTRSGLQVRVGYNRDNKNEMGERVYSSFFSSSDLYTTEEELRRKAYKWDTARHKKVVKRGSSLKDPEFTVYYHTREDGHSAASPRPLPYALIVTIRAPKMKDIHDQILRRIKFRTKLSELKPRLTIPPLRS